MDWDIKSLARASFASGQTFAQGEQVTCLIFRGPEGLQRADLTQAEAAEWRPPGALLGRWVRRMTDEGEDERARRRQSLASAEEVFLALVQEGDAAGPDTELLLQVLALQLERKRILRPLGRPAQGVQRYLHPRLQQEFAVPRHDLTPERVAQLQAQLHRLAY
jgi:hypothetical protein